MEEGSSKVQKKYRIMLVEDDELVSTSLTQALEEEGYEVCCVSDGKQAQQLATLEKVDGILSDINLPGSSMTGIHLLHFVKQTLQIPVILMTGFSSLMEIQEANELGAVGFLAKPFSKDELLQLLRSIPGLALDKPPEDLKKNSEASYCKVNIDDFTSGKQIQYSIFIRLSESRFIKIAHHGEDLDMQRIQVYKEKGIRHLYLLKDDFHKYMRFSLNLVQAVTRSSKISEQKKTNFIKHTQELVLEQIYKQEMDATSFEDAQVAVETSLSYLSDYDDTLNLLQSLNTHSDALYAHSIGVSFYSAVIGRKMMWKSQAALHKLSMGGLLHDVGKKQIERKILDKSPLDLSPEEVKTLETHPKRGAELLSQVQSVPEEVLQIVMQHHERDSGMGYPTGLSRARIFPMARVIAVADEFCKLVIKSPYQPGLKPQDALFRLFAVSDNVLDPAMLRILAELFNMDTDQFSKNSSASSRARKH